MHLDEGQLQRLVDDEIAADGDEWVSEHLGHCESCRQRLVNARTGQNEIFALLGTLDHSRPAIPRLRIIERAHVRRNVWIGRAAGVLLAGALAGAAYAASGLPLPSIVSGIFGIDDGPVEQHEPEGRSVVTSPAGVSVDPGSQMVVTFSGTQTGGRVIVSLAEESEISVRSAGIGPSFTSGSNILIIERAGSGEFAVKVPRSAPLVELRIDTVSVFLKNGARIVSSGSARDGTWVIPFTRSR